MYQILGHNVSVSISDILAAASLLLAFDQWRKNRTAQQAVHQLKTSLFKQRSSQYFDELSRKAATLSSSLRSRDWAEVSKLATELGGLISSAAGFSHKLILEDEKDELQLAMTSVKAIWGGIPVSPEQQAVNDDKIEKLMEHCMVIVYAVDRVGGRMKYLGEVEEEGAKPRLTGWFGDLSGKKKAKEKRDSAGGATGPGGQE